MKLIRKLFTDILKQEIESIVIPAGRITDYHKRTHFPIFIVVQKNHNTGNTYVCRKSENPRLIFYSLQWRHLLRREKSEHRCKTTNSRLYKASNTFEKVHCLISVIRDDGTPSAFLHYLYELDIFSWHHVMR